MKGRLIIIALALSFLFAGSGCVRTFRTKRSAFSPPPVSPVGAGRGLRHRQTAVNLRGGTTGAGGPAGISNSAIPPIHGDPGLWLPELFSEAAIRTALGRSVELGGRLLLAPSTTTVPSRAGLAPLPNMRDMFGAGPTFLAKIRIGRHYTLSFGLDFNIYSIPYTVYRVNEDDYQSCTSKVASECRPEYNIVNKGSKLFVQWNTYIINNFHIGPVTLFLATGLQNNVDNVGFDDSYNDDDTLTTRTLPMMLYGGVEVSVARWLRLHASGQFLLGPEDLFANPAFALGAEFVF